MRKIVLFLAVITLLVNVGCSRKSEDTGTFPEINIWKGVQNQTELKLSQLGSKITYVSLETTEDCLIGQVPRDMKITDKYIIISNGAYDGNNCFVFDRFTGKFLNNLGHSGQDPEAFSISYNFAIDNKKDMVAFRTWMEKLVLYNFKDKYEGDFILPVSATDLNSYIYNGNDIIAYTGTNLRNINGRSLLRINSQGQVLDSLQVLPPTNFTDEDYGMGVLNLVLAGSELTGKGDFYIQLMKSTYNYYSVTNNQALWECGDKVRFYQVFGDTIYNYNRDNTLTPAFTLNMGPDGVNFENMTKKEMTDKTPIIFNILENPDIILLYGSLGPLKTLDFKTNTKLYAGIYNKSDNGLVFGEASPDWLEENGYGLTDDINDFVSFLPGTVSLNGEYAGLITMEHISAWLGKNPDYKFPDKLAWIKDLSEDSNPIVAIISK